TNMDFTLKTNPLARGDLDEFVECFHADNRFERTSTWSPSEELGRWRAFTYEELLTRDKVNLDIFWLRDESLEDSANLPNPDVLAAEIVEDLRSALAQFEGIAEELGQDGSDLL
ncbi:MAG: SAM-dependent DNA methyltransferase, partial [Chloroflexota bacterium]